jgi:hypothetical protein
MSRMLLRIGDSVHGRMISHSNQVNRRENEHNRQRQEDTKERKGKEMKDLS